MLVREGGRVDTLSVCTIATNAHERGIIQSGTIPGQIVRAGHQNFESESGGALEV
jgi:hypothetical protein